MLESTTGLRARPGAALPRVPLPALDPPALPYRHCDGLKVWDGRARQEVGHGPLASRPDHPAALLRGPLPRGYSVWHVCLYWPGPAWVPRRPSHVWLRSLHGAPHVTATATAAAEHVHGVGGGTDRHLPGSLLEPATELAAAVAALQRLPRHWCGWPRGAAVEFGLGEVDRRHRRSPFWADTNAVPVGLTARSRASGRVCGAALVVQGRSGARQRNPPLRMRPRATPQLQNVAWCRR